MILRFSLVYKVTSSRSCDIQERRKAFFASSTTTLEHETRFAKNGEREREVVKCHTLLRYVQF